LRKPYLSIITTSFVILLDYLTKKLVVKYVGQSGAIPVLPFLRIVYVQNKGAAFGLFQDVGNTVFIIVSLIAIILIILYQLNLKKGLEIFSFSLILGGATGNLIDRLTVGSVIDFIDLFIGRWHWPAFNVADSALTVGIVLFLMSNLKRRQR